MKTAGDYSLPLKAGSPMNPSEINNKDVRAERQGFFDKMKMAFGSQIKSELTIGIRTLGNLIATKQKYIMLLPGHCIIHKKLLPFVAQYRAYLGDAILSEQIQHFKQVEQGMFSK